MLRAATPTIWERAQTYAGDVATVVDWPTTDAAAVIGVDAIWLGGILLGLKIVATGLWYEFRRDGRRS